MLKRLFTSNTRIKLLTVFLMNPGQEFFIRELTRKLNEQINSIRRELDNLKKTGFLRAKVKNRKKYYLVNENFIFFEELKSIITKAVSTNQKLANDIDAMGKIKLLALSGIFVGEDTKTVDMLIVGELDREKFAAYLNNEVITKRPVKFTIMNEDDYSYRISCKDKFLGDTINDPDTQFLIRRI